MTLTYFLKNETLCGGMLRARVAFRSSLWLAIVLFWVRVCQWEPLWIPVGDSIQKAHLEKWIHMSDDSSTDLGEQCMANIPTMVQGTEYKDCTTPKKRPGETPSAPRSSWQAGGEHDTLTWKLSGTQGTASFRETTEAPLPLARPRCNFIHPKQPSPFPEHLKMPFSRDEVLSGYEDAWVKTDPDDASVRHVVGVQKAVAEFREAPERVHDTSSQAYQRA